MSLTISGLTISKTNEIPLEITINENNYPVAPLTFAEGTFSDKSNNLDDPHYIVRVVVFMPFEVTTPPTLVVGNDGEAQTVITEGGQALTARSFTLQYDYSSKIVPQRYTLWNVNFEYRLNGLPPVDYIVTYLENMDPKTSRGTVTTVQQP